MTYILIQILLSLGILQGDIEKCPEEKIGENLPGIIFGNFDWRCDEE